MARQECEWNGTPFSCPVFGFVIPLPIIIFCQLVLLIHTFCHYKDLSKIPISLTSLYIALQFSGISWTLHDFFKHFILPKFYPTFIHNASLCNFTSYWDKISPPLFEFLLLSQILLRLELTFKDSPTQSISKIARVGLWMFLIIPFCILTALWLGFTSPICYRKWIPSDANETFYFCSASTNYGPGSISLYASYAAAFWILCGNLLFGLLFSLKLKRILNGSKDDDRNKTHEHVRKVMIKNTILTISVSGSTLIFWTLFFVDIGDWCLYLDIFLNTLFLGLMFRYNDKLYYKVFCRLCDQCYQRKNKHVLELVDYTSNTETKTATSKQNPVLTASSSTESNVDASYV